MDDYSEKQDYVSLEELYVHAPNAFKARNLKGFVVANHLAEEDWKILKGKRLVVSAAWVRDRMPDFKLCLEPAPEDNAQDRRFFKVRKVLDDYGVKSFNPMTMRLTSSEIQYFDCDGVRTPYFTVKGLLKVKVSFNDVPNNLWEWFVELFQGDLTSQIDNLENVKEMVKIKHAPLMRKVGDRTVLIDHVYDIRKDDVVADFKRVAALKRDVVVGKDVQGYTCPLFDKLRSAFEASVEHRDQKMRELKQEKALSHLKQELEREKSLRELTTSFAPPRAHLNPSQSSEPRPSLKPSKIC